MATLLQFGDKGEVAETYSLLPWPSQTLKPGDTTHHPSHMYYWQHIRHELQCPGLSNTTDTTAKVISCPVSHKKGKPTLLLWHQELGMLPWTCPGVAGERNGWSFISVMLWHLLQQVWWQAALTLGLPQGCPSGQIALGCGDPSASQAQSLHRGWPGHGHHLPQGLGFIPPACVCTRAGTFLPHCCSRIRATQPGWQLWPHLPPCPQ